jgi:hypothetical protein
MAEFGDSDCIESMKKLEDPAARDQVLLHYEAWRVNQSLED